MYLLESELTTETMIDPSNAYQKLSTEKPLMKVPANQNNQALITKVKRPKVIILIGNVNIKIIGLTNKFSNPITTAAIIAGYNPSTLIPGINSVTNSSTKATSSTRVISFIPSI